MANGIFGGGTGTYGNPYIIEDGKDLSAIRYFFENPETSTYKYFKITRDINLNIDLNGKNWEPIKYFYGQIDGDRHVIRGLSIKNYSDDTVGFILSVKIDKKEPIMKNLCFTGINIKGKKNVCCLFCDVTVAGSSTDQMPLIKNVSLIGEISGKYMAAVTNSMLFYYHVILSEDCYFDIKYTPTSTESMMATICDTADTTYSSTSYITIKNTIIKNSVEGSDKKIKVFPSYQKTSISSKIDNVIVNKDAIDEDYDGMNKISYDEFSKLNKLFDKFLYNEDENHNPYWFINNDGIKPSLLDNNIILIKSDEGIFTYQDSGESHLKKLDNVFIPDTETFLSKGIKNAHQLKGDFWNEVKTKLHNVAIYNMCKNMYTKNTEVDSINMKKVVSDKSESDNKHIYKYSYTFTGKEEFTINNIK